MRIAGEKPPSAIASTTCGKLRRGGNGVGRVEPRAAPLGDLFGAQTEDENIFAADTSRISILAPSSVPMVNAPFSASFMLPVPEASIPAVEICSERSADGMIASARLTL